MVETQTKSDCERLAEFLDENARCPSRVHYMTIYGMGMMGHSRIADLRRRGWDIECIRDRGEYFYTVHFAPGDKKKEQN